MKKIIAGLPFCVAIVMAFSVGLAGAQFPGMPETGLPSDCDINVTLELKSNGQCEFTLEASGPSMVGDMGLEESPFTGLDGSLTISSPSSGKLKLELNETSVTLNTSQLEPEDIAQIGEMVLGFQMYPSEVNAMFKGQIEQMLQGMGLPPELSDLGVDSATVTTLTWSEPTLTAGMQITLSSEAFENEELRDQLPINVELAVSITSTSLSVNASVTNEVNVSLELNADQDSTELSLLASFPLERGENNQVIFQGLPPEMAGALESSLEQLESTLDELTGANNVSFSLKLPPGATVSGDLPGDPDVSGSTYTWEEGSISDVFEPMMTGELPGISYTATAEEGEEGETNWLLWVGIIVVIAAIGATVAVLAKRK